MGNDVGMMTGRYDAAYTARPADRAGRLAGSQKQVENEKKQGVESQECQTCKERKYQDVSNDSSVSFQTPTHISPEMAASAVRAHEQEHVAHNAENASEQGMTAHSTVMIHTRICPECHRIYVSGGTTTTTYAVKQVPTESEAKGNNIDTLA